MSFPALLMRLLLCALLILNGSADAWAATVGAAAHAGGHAGHAAARSAQPHCASQGNAAADGHAHEEQALGERAHGEQAHGEHAQYAMSASHDAGTQCGGALHHDGMQADGGGDHDCCNGHPCGQVCHAHATSLAAIPAPLQAAAFGRGQNLFPADESLRAAPPPHQPIRPPIS